MCGKFEVVYTVSIEFNGNRSTTLFYLAELIRLFSNIPSAQALLSICYNSILNSLYVTNGQLTRFLLTRYSEGQHTPKQKPNLS